MSLCATCARHERTCCQDTDVLLTDGDIRRIEAATGRSDFWEFRVPQDPENRNPYPDDPNWLDYTVRPDGTRAQLKHQPSRDCVFLGAAGCTLAAGARPLTCLLYPHEYNEERLTGHHNGCPVRFLAPGADLFGAIGMARERAEAWRAQIYRELREGSVYRDNLARKARGEDVDGARLAARLAAPPPRPVIAVVHAEVAENPAPDDLDTLVQAHAVARALRELGYAAEPVPFGADRGATASALGALRPIAAFNLVETIAGSGRGVEAAPRFLESLGIPYTGTRASALAATADKLATKQALAAAGVPTPPWTEVAPPAFAAPWIVKSVWEHASIGIGDDGVVATEAALSAALDARRGSAAGPSYVEQYVDGREFAVSLLAAPGGTRDAGEPEVIAISEILFEDYPKEKPRIVNYAAKWEADSFEHHHTPRRFMSPAAEPALFEEIAAIARASWRTFDLRGYARVDLRVDPAGRPWVVDVNSNPCIAPDSGFAAAAEHAGVPYTEVVRRILTAP